MGSMVGTSTVNRHLQGRMTMKRNSTVNEEKREIMWRELWSSWAKQHSQGTNILVGKKIDRENN